MLLDYFARQLDGDYAGPQYMHNDTKSKLDDPALHLHFGAAGIDAAAIAWEVMLRKRDMLEEQELGASAAQRRRAYVAPQARAGRRPRWFCLSAIFHQSNILQ